MRTICRSLALLLAALALVLSFAACTSKEGGLCFRTPQGVDVWINQSADSVIADLGTPLSKNESASCGGLPGNDCVYTYAGYRVKTTPAEGGDVVCQIELTDDSLKTPEGVYIGMKAEDAKAAMSEKANRTPETVGENLVYKAEGKDLGKLQILVRDGYVTGILYVAD